MTFEKLRLGLYMWDVQFESETFKIFFPGWLSVGNPRKVMFAGTWVNEIFYSLKNFFSFKRRFFQNFTTFIEFVKKNKKTDSCFIFIVWWENQILYYYYYYYYYCYFLFFLGGGGVRD